MMNTDEVRLSILSLAVGNDSTDRLAEFSDFVFRGDTPGSARPANFFPAGAIAKIAHEVNRAWCEFYGDFSQPSWEDAPEWLRSSAISGVAFHRANPDAGDSASHDSWMAEKVAAGWVYGVEKDPDANPPTHPCLLPFAALPADQQFKDRLFRTIVHAAA